MTDIFDHPILCKHCHVQMEKGTVTRQGFRLRALRCPHCAERVVHPGDLSEFQKFSELRRKEYLVKMRLVGNSYAVSIPKEIVSFLQERQKMMDDMVRLCLEDRDHITLSFYSLTEENSDGK